MADTRRGFRSLQDEQDFIRGFVNDSGPVAVAQEQVQRRPPPRVRTAADQRTDAARRQFREDTKPVEPGLFGAFRSTVGEPFGTTVRAERERERNELAQQNAVATQARQQARNQPGLRAMGAEAGPPSGRQFEFNPGPGRGLRGEIEFETAQPGFEDRVRESIAAGAFDPVTPERVESARQVHQANLRALRGMRGVAAARRGVPEQFLDAVRQGHITNREAVMMGAQQPTARGGGGLTPAQMLSYQQGEREQGLRERQFAFNRQKETNRMLTDEEPAVRNEGRRQAAADYANNPDDPIAQETMGRAASRLLNDLGNPGPLSYLWFDLLGGSPQGILDPDTKASVRDVMSGEGFSMGYGYRGRGTRPSDGTPVLLHRGNPVDEWKDILSADPDVANFLLDVLDIPSRRQRGLRQR